jgi:TRAP-type C4-dicarboxylate transport system substrate-binding protein
VRPIVRPEDLKGIKLRTPKGVWRVRMFQAYGAHPAPMAYSEVFMALQTGVMDGQENPLPQITGGRFQEVQKFMSMSGHVYTPAYVTVGASFAKLPPDVQKILTQAARETQPYVYETAARLDNELIGVIKAAGTRVNEVDKDASSRPRGRSTTSSARKCLARGRWSRRRSPWARLRNNRRPRPTFQVPGLGRRKHSEGLDLERPLPL